MTVVCESACWTATKCGACGLEVGPVGRSIPMEAAGSFCDCRERALDLAVETGDYSALPGTPRRHLWDEHDEVRAILDPQGWELHVATCDQCRWAAGGWGR